MNRYMFSAIAATSSVLVAGCGSESYTASTTTESVTGTATVTQVLPSRAEREARTDDNFKAAAKEFFVRINQGDSKTILREHRFGTYDEDMDPKEEQEEAATYRKRISARVKRLASKYRGRLNVEQLEFAPAIRCEEIGTYKCRLLKIPDQASPSRSHKFTVGGVLTKQNGRPVSADGITDKDLPLVWNIFVHDSTELEVA